MKLKNSLFCILATLSKILASGKQKDETKGISKKERIERFVFKDDQRAILMVWSKKSAKMDGPDDVTMMLQ